MSVISGVKVVRDHCTARTTAFVVLVTVASIALASLWRRAPIDDAYITFRYALNLLRGNGFVYNPGEWVLGTTTPLWGILLAGISSLGISLENGAVFGGGLCGVALVTAFFLSVLRDESNRCGWLPATLWILAVVGYYPNQIVLFAGMETPLYTCAVFAGLACFGAGRPQWGGVCAALATLLRPDGALVVIAGLVSMAIDRRCNRKTFVGACLPYLVIVAPCVLWGHWLYGDYAPHSIAAKRILYPASPLQNLLYFFEALSQTAVDSIVLCLGGAGLALGAWRSAARSPYAVWVVLYGLGIVLSGVKPIFFWYFGPVWILLITVGFDGLRRHFSMSQRQLSTAAILVVVLIGGDAWNRLRVRDAVEVREDAYRSIVQEYKDRIAPSDTVMVGETGILGYGLPDATIIDSSGITSPGVLQILRSERSNIGPFADLQRSAPWAAHIIERYRPRWIIGPRGRMQLAVLADQPWFVTQYEEVGVYVPKELGGVVVLKRR